MKTAGHYLLLLAVAVLCVFPFWWTLVTAVSSEGNIFAFPPTFWPKAPTLDNFAEVFRVIPMLDFFRNSVAITALTVLWKLVFCSMAAYPLARLHFRGRKLVFGVILATLVLPSEVNFLVNFITVTKLSLVDTYTGVILPNVVTAVAILLTLVYAVGLIFRPRTRIAGMGVDSLTVIVLYLLGVGGLVAITVS